MTIRYKSWCDEEVYCPTAIALQKGFQKLAKQGDLVGIKRFCLAYKKRCRDNYLQCSKRDKKMMVA